MKNLLLLVLCCTVSFSSWAQFAVGHTTITFNDPTRSGGFGSGGGPGRQIQTEVYYPATMSGTNMPMVAGAYPVIIFGHGFVISWDAYEPFYMHWASKGYVVALPRTEGGLSPSHMDFAEDLGKVSHDIQSLATTDPSSIFYQNLNQKICIAGHSMGGGAAILSNPFQIAGTDCFLTFAAAETSPSSIQAATMATAPALFISGSYDCVVPTATQSQMYDSMASACKTHIEFTKAYHCQFNAYNFNCATGESTCFTPGGIARDTQINRTLAYTDDFLDFYLKNKCESWTSFKAKYDINYGTLSSKKNTCTFTIPSAPTLSFNGSDLNAAGAGFNLYLWKLNNTIIPSSGTSTFTPTQNGTYSVCAYTAVGCYVESAPYVVNALGVNGIHTNLAIQYFIKDKSVHIKSEKPLNAQLYSLNGVMLYQGQNEEIIDLSHLASGLYILQLGKKNTWQRQLILLP